MEVLYQSPLGKLQLKVFNGALISLKFCDEKKDEKNDDELSEYSNSNKNEDKNEYENKDKIALRKTIEWLDTYFEGKCPSFLPPISFPRATCYQKLVWRELCTIPYGATATYLSIAQKVAKATNKHPSPQATGGALHSNPIAIIVPCHRVILSNGALGGYAYGEDKKRALLNLENKNIK